MCVVGLGGVPGRVTKSTKLYLWRLFSAVLSTLLPATSLEAGVSDAVNSKIISPQQARPLFRQCSRADPAPGQGFSQPDPRQIGALEAALPQVLQAARAHGRPAPVIDLARWQRQYVGIVRGGRRLLYGNFFPSDSGGRGAWRKQAIVVCDGGPDFFGVAFDIATRRFTSVDFNGPFLLPERSRAK